MLEVRKSSGMSHNGFQTPNLPTGEMPTDELIEHMTSRYNKRRKAKDAREPIPIKLSTDEPIELLFFGDPHLDSPQCDRPELRRCVRVCESTEGLFEAFLWAIIPITG